MGRKRKLHLWGDENGVARRSGFDSTQHSGWTASTRSTFAEPSRHGRPRRHRGHGPGAVGLAMLIAALLIASYLVVLALWPLVR